MQVIFYMKCNTSLMNPINAIATKAPNHKEKTNEAAPQTDEKNSLSPK